MACDIYRSVESFERKLDEAQKNLELPLEKRIPVYYVDEIDWADQLIKYCHAMPPPLRELL